MTKFPSNLQVVSVPNEGARSKVQGNLFNKMGRVKGHTDLYMFWVIGETTFIAWLEMKKPTGALSKSQNKFLNSIPFSTNSFKGAAYSFVEGRDLVTKWVERSKVVSLF